MNQDRFAEHIYIALSARYCHTPLIYNSTAKPLILSKHRFKVSMEYLPNNSTYRIRLFIDAPNIDKTWELDYYLNANLVGATTTGILLNDIVGYFEAELGKVFLNVAESSDIAKKLYGV